MRKLLTVLLLLAASAAQTQARGQTPDARMIDAFGDIQISDFLARADNFAIELQNNPQAKGYVVAYIVPNRFPGFPLRRAFWARGYLINGRGFDASRVEVINGGYRDEIGFEFWVADAGAKPPREDFDFGPALRRERTPFLFDRYEYQPRSRMGTGIEDGYVGYLDEAGWFAPYAGALLSDKAARGAVIAYATPRNRRGSDRALAALVKRTIMRHHSVGAERIIPVAGGVRAHRLVELWIVPPGAALPRPTPDARAVGRKRRRD